ncbi:dTDP-4-dehydrorhamnose 3,5-epimerase [Flavobacteriaceae bacterium]|nr:dTDP-4-dehydrorhamnose 3,5-epimerase [Flavobacteriaceae bacterium]
MRFTRLTIPELVLIEPVILGDDRGYFSETFKQQGLNEFLGQTINFCQDSESKSSFGVLRGLHYQLAPHAQTKLVRVVEGTVLDVAVDIRQTSPTFGKHIVVELSSQNKKQLLIPKGFAHGFVVLSEEAIFSYKVDNYYQPRYERGIAFNDTTLKIDWKVELEDLKLSSKDQKQPLFKDADYFQ